MPSARQGNDCDPEQWSRGKVKRNSRLVHGIMQRMFFGVRLQAQINFRDFISIQHLMHSLSGAGIRFKESGAKRFVAGYQGKKRPAKQRDIEVAIHHKKTRQTVGD